MRLEHSTSIWDPRLTLKMSPLEGDENCSACFILVITREVFYL